MVSNEEKMDVDDSFDDNAEMNNIEELPTFTSLLDGVH